MILIHLSYEGLLITDFGVYFKQERIIKNLVILSLDLYKKKNKWLYIVNRRKNVHNLLNFHKTYQSIRPIIYFGMSLWYRTKGGFNN